MVLDAFLNPERVVESFDVRPGEHVADFGCGAGFFTIPIAQKVGTKGRVYALDVRPEALEAARGKAKLFHLLNIDFSAANLERVGGSGLRNESVDKVIVSNVLFQSEDKDGLAEEAYRVLKTGGSAIVIDWSEERSTGGPPLAQRVGKEETRTFFKNAGFSFYKEFSAGSHHFGLVFKK